MAVLAAFAVRREPEQDLAGYLDTAVFPGAALETAEPDPDDVAERFERAVRDLTSAVGTVMVTTGFDTRDIPVLKHLRGKIATYTAHVRAIADRYDCPVLDLCLRAGRRERAGVWGGKDRHR